MQRRPALRGGDAGLTRGAVGRRTITQLAAKKQAAAPDPEAPAATEAAAAAAEAPTAQQAEVPGVQAAAAEASAADEAIIHAYMDEDRAAAPATLPPLPAVPAAPSFMPKVHPVRLQLF